MDGEDTMDDSESNSDEVPEMMANLSVVALDGMDPDNSKELEKDKKNMQQAERQREWQQAKRYMRTTSHKSVATSGGANKHQSNMMWARQYLPQDRHS